MMKPREPANQSSEKRDIETALMEQDKDTLCGIGKFHPAILQVFARIGAFVGVYSISGLFTSTLTIYVNSQVSMLEKQFGFSSAETGLLMSCNDIGYLCTVIFAGYIARKVHIPRGLGISTILYGICGILCALPYFLQDRSMYAIDSASSTGNMTRMTVERPTPLCLNNTITAGSADCSSNSAEMTYNMEKLWIKKMAFALIAIGMVFQGVGKSPRYPFVTLYIDDAVDKRKTGFYMGIISGIGIFGPAIAYLLGGVFSKMYVTLEAVDITPRDPRWIGAWWLGFLVFGACSVVFSLPMMCFPRKLRTKHLPPVEDKKKTSQTKKSTPNILIKEAKQMLKSVIRVMSNPVFAIITFSSCINMVSIAGTISFMPKYFASQYSIPLWKANILMAVSSLLAASIGSFSGGLITRKVAMTPQTTMKLLSIFYVVNLALSSTGYFLGCDQPTLIGGGTAVTSGDPSALYIPQDNQCLDGCGCDDSKYFPICGEDGNTYYSPCHAGCSDQDKTTFHNCTCIPSGKATPGLCDQGCSTNLYIYAVFNFFGALSGTLKIVPLFIAKLRCVKEKDRAVSTALSGFLYSALGWMPGPIIFGAIIDGTCKLWKYSCGERLSCQLYDIIKFRVAIISFGMVARGAAFLMILGLYIYFRVTKRENWREDSKPTAKEILINAEKTKENGDYKPLPNSEHEAGVIIVDI